MPVEALAVPSCCGGVGCDVRVVVFERARVSAHRANRRAEVAPFGGDESERTGAEGVDLKRAVMVSDVMPFA